jgi:iron complex outermembrane receptor protein
MRGTLRLSIIALAIACFSGLPSLVYGADPAQYDLDIDPQPLSRALQEFAKQSGIQIIFFSKVTNGHDAPALKGKFTAAAALTRLLKNTELTFREINPKTIEIRPRDAETSAGTSSNGSISPQEGAAVDLTRAVEFNIAPQPLGTAVIEFSKQADVQIIASGTNLDGIRSRAVRGRHTIEGALRELLGGSGFGFRVVGEKTITLVSPVGGAEAAGATDALSAAAERAARAGLQETIVVTGTYIRSEAPSSPVIVIDESDIERSGYQSTGDLIRSLPQSFGGGYNPTPAAPVNNPSRASSPNLRGLGSESTLTLVNGRRLAYADQVSNVDVTVIPLSAVERVEIMTDGGSAIYGADAVAGVVNFILKRDFEGIQARATLGDSTQGGGPLQQYGVLAGRKWGDGGAVASYEFARQDPLFARQRSFTSANVAAETLVPDTERNSLFVSANQSVLRDLTLNGHALYTKRSVDYVLDSTRFLQGLFAYGSAGVEQYGVSVGASLDVKKWRIAFAADDSKNKTDATIDNLLNGTSIQLLQQRFHTGLRQFEVSANGPLFEVRAGSIDLAIGAAKREESFSGRQGTATRTFQQVPGADRDVQSVYAEANIPLLGRTPEARRLSLNVAARHEDYSDFGSSTNPKVGLVFRPTESVRVKGSWGKSFRTASLLQEYLPQSASFSSTPNPSSPTGSSFVLTRGGGNRELQPEKSETTTANAIFAPRSLPGASLELTLYKIRYENRVILPILSRTPLTDPLAGPFILRNPTASQLAEIVASAATFSNFTQPRIPYDPALVVAVIDQRYVNALNQDAAGIDMLARYILPLLEGELDLSLNVPYLDLKQKLTSVSPEQDLSGTIFNPPRTRARAGAAWQRRPWSTAAFVNYVGTSRDTFSSARPKIASWTTADMHLSYDLGRGGLFRGLRLLMSIQNVFDRDPPFVPDSASSVVGFHYDSTNASAVGRFLSLQVIKDW